MDQFFGESTCRAIKQHRCDSCQKPILVGEEYIRMAGKYEGEFWSGKNHPECRKAEIGLAQLHDLCGGEDWLFLHNLEREDVEWVMEHHPEAYKRIEINYEHLFEDGGK